MPTKTVFENVSFALRVLGTPIEQQRRRTYQVLKWVGLQHRQQAYPAGAVGRRATACRDRARAGQRAAAGPGRRADRQPRSRSLARNHEPVPRHQRERHDRAGRDARSRADQVGRPAHRASRARPAAGDPRRRRSRAAFRHEGASLFAAGGARQPAPRGPIGRDVDRARSRSPSSRSAGFCSSPPTCSASSSAGRRRRRCRSFCATTSTRRRAPR